MADRFHLHSVGQRTPNYKSDPDFYQTPAVATQALLRRWRPPAKRIWEPACGCGAISEVLLAERFKVMSTDLFDRGYGIGGVDFLRCRRVLGDVIITNPPFNRADDFVGHAMELVDVSAFLLRLAWLEGIGRYERFYSRGMLSHVFAFPQRLPRMHREDYEGRKTTNTTAYAWFVFDRRGGHKTAFDWLPLRARVHGFFEEVPENARLHGFAL